jgi:hypothetical protein
MNTIYIFATNNTPFGQAYLAMAEDGTQLAGHFCSNLDWAKKDMTTSGKISKYKKHYPNGYNLRILEIGGLPPDKVLELAKAKYDNPTSEAGAEIKLTFR